MARGIIFCGAWIRLWIRSAASTYNSREYVSIRDHPGPRVKSLPAAAHSSITLVYHSGGRWEKEKRSPGEHTRLSRLVLRFLMDNLRYFDLPVFDPTLRFSFFTRWQCDGQVYHSMATFHSGIYEVAVFSVKEVLFCFNGYSESSEPYLDVLEFSICVIRLSSGLTRIFRLGLVRSYRVYDCLKFLTFYQS